MDVDFGWEHIKTENENDILDHELATLQKSRIGSNARNDVWDRLGRQDGECRLKLSESNQNTAATGLLRCSLHCTWSYETLITALLDDNVGFGA